MTVRMCIVSWGRMNAEGAGAWAVYGRDGRLLGLYRTEARALAAVWQVQTAMRLRAGR